MELYAAVRRTCSEGWSERAAIRAGPRDGGKMLRYRLRPGYRGRACVRSWRPSRHRSDPPEISTAEQRHTAKRICEAYARSTTSRAATRCQSLPERRLRKMLRVQKLLLLVEVDRHDRRGIEALAEAGPADPVEAEIRSWRHGCHRGSGYRRGLVIRSFSCLTDQKALVTRPR